MHSKIKPEILALWLEALRSGTFQQGTGKLCRLYGDTGERYCCLGVLTQLYINKNEHAGDWIAAYDDNSAFKRFNNASNYLPYAVAEWAGIVESSGGRENMQFDIVLDNIPMTHLNDGNPEAGIEPQSFEEIADRLESAAKDDLIKFSTSYN